MQHRTGMAVFHLILQTTITGWWTFTIGTCSLQLHHYYYYHTIYTNIYHQISSLFHYAVWSVLCLNMPKSSHLDLITLQADTLCFINFTQLHTITMFSVGLNALLYWCYDRSGQVIWKKTAADNFHRFCTDWTPLLSPNQQCQSTAENLTHKPLPGRISHWTFLNRQLTADGSWKGLLHL